MKQYKFEVIVKEGNDEFWESLENRSGCDEVLEMIQQCFDVAGIEPKVRLVEYTDE